MEERTEDRAAAQKRPPLSEADSVSEAVWLASLGVVESADLASAARADRSTPAVRGRAADAIDWDVFMVANTGPAMASSVFAHPDNPLPMVETAKASSTADGPLSGRSKTVTPLSAPPDQVPPAGRGSGVVAGQAVPALTPLTAATTSSRSPANLGSMPLRFEVNEGQTDAAVRFLAHGPSYNLFLASSEAVLVLGGSAPISAGPAADPAALQPDAIPAVLRMQIVGGNSAAQAVGLDKLPGKVNYYLGNDPVNWHAGISSYAQVAFRDIYPGIDLIYHSHDGQLEYDFNVAAGTDPGAITLAFAGADQLAVDAQGDLLVNTAGTQLRQHKPLVYQEGNGGRQPVAGNFVIEDGQRVGFQVGSYDRSQPLVIDPVLSYSTYLGGASSDGGTAIAVDQAGQVYVTGGTNSANFPTLDPFQPNLGRGLGNAFVTSLDSAGQPLYSTYFGGNGFDNGNGIAVDLSGHVYVTGQTSSLDFPTQNAFQLVHGGGFYDAFVTSLDGAGQLVYSTYLGGSANDIGAAIGVDASGHAVVAGSTGSHDFPTLDAFQPDLAGISNAFVTSLDSAGQPIYSTYLGGSGKDVVHGLAVDPNGHAYVTGETSSNDFPTQNAFQATLGGFENAFVASLDPGGHLVYSTYLGGRSADYGLGIAADSYGNAYVTGTTYSANFPTVHAVQEKLTGLANAFVTGLDSAGQPLYSTYLGGGKTDSGLAIAVDQAGHVYLTGPTNSTDFPTVNAFQPGYGGGLYDAFVTSLDPAGQLLYSSYLGGASEDYGSGIAVDLAGHAYVTGSTGSHDFPTRSPFQGSLGGIQNAFVAMIA